MSVEYNKLNFREFELNLIGLWKKSVFCPFYQGFFSESVSCVRIVCIKTYWVFICIEVRNFSGFIANNKIFVEFFNFLVVSSNQSNFYTEDFLDGLLYLSFVNVETWRISNWLKFYIQSLFKIFEIFKQKIVLKKDGIMTNLLELSVIKKLVDNCEPGFF